MTIQGGKGKSLPKVDIYASETDEGSSKTAATNATGEIKKTKKKKVSTTDEMIDLELMLALKTL